MRRFYFTSENHCDGNNPCYDHFGNIRGAITIAQKVANELNETVYINDCYTGDIVDVIEPDYPVENSESDMVSETVENYPKKYMELGLYNSKLRSCEDLKAIYGIDVEKIKGFKNLGINADFFKRILVHFYNAYGIEERAKINPLSVKFVRKNRKSVSSFSYLRLDIKYGDIPNWYHLLGDGTWY